MQHFQVTNVIHVRAIAPKKDIYSHEMTFGSRKEGILKYHFREVSFFTRMGGSSICDELSPILSGPPFDCGKKIGPPLRTRKNSGPPD